jgi:NADPH-dependent glutamate synthase beta subunit-like oxidoreductase
MRRVRQRSKSGRHDPHANPKFRLPDSVIDEECGYILDLGVEFRSGKRIDSLKALLAEEWDAIFIGSGAPRGRDLDIPGRQEAAKNIHIGIDWLSSVSFGHISKIGRRVVVLGGGNTAMDCCRSARRLGGEQVDVVVRSGFEEMKASPWEKEDAMHEGIPIHNYLVPKEFTLENGKLTGITFEKVKAEYDAKGRRKLVSAGEPDQHFPCDDAGRGRSGKRVSWIERDIGIEFDQWGMPKVDTQTMASTHPKVFFGGDAAFGPKISSGLSRMGTRRPSRSTKCSWRRHHRPPCTRGRGDEPEDGHPRMVLRQRDCTR